MDQEMMQLKHELKEFVERGHQILQKMDGSMSQRFYGMRTNGNGGGYSGGQGGYSGNQGGNSGGNYNQREWPQMNPNQMGPMQQGMGQFPMQGNFPQQNYSPYDMMQGMNPLYFM